MPSNTNQGDVYLEAMVEILEKAEDKLRADIDYRGLSFSQSRLADSQANVDRLHGLIRSYKQLESQKTNGKQL